MGESAPRQASKNTASKVNKTFHCFYTHLGHSFAFRCVAILTVKLHVELLSLWQAKKVRASGCPCHGICGIIPATWQDGLTRGDLVCREWNYWRVAYGVYGESFCFVIFGLQSVRKAT